jgi:hypothetical protein
MDNLEQTYRALLRGIVVCQVTDPAARARVLREIEVQYRSERAAQRRRRPGRRINELAQLDF